MSYLGGQAAGTDLVGNVAHVQQDWMGCDNSLMAGQNLRKATSARTLPRNASAGGSVLQRGRIKGIPELSRSTYVLGCLFSLCFIPFSLMKLKLS